jgi:hypothetical protein
LQHTPPLCPARERLYDNVNFTPDLGSLLSEEGAIKTDVA